MSYNHIQNEDKKLLWADISEPADEDRMKMAELADFAISDISDALTGVSRSQIIKRKDYIFFMMSLPVYNVETNLVDVDSFSLFIGKKFVLSVHNGTLPPLNDLFQNARQDKRRTHELMEHGVEHLVYEIIRNVQEYTYPMVDYIDNASRELKKAIFEDRGSRETVEDILRLRQNLTDMRQAMRSHEAVIARLAKHNPDEKVLHVVKNPVLFRELTENANEFWNELESGKEMVEALEDANDALISHNLNDVMKTLTLVSVILLPGSLIAGIFGMNFSSIPFVGNELDFWLAIGIIGVVSILLFFIFWRKHWLR